jgi:hypothetical protein
VVSIFATYTTNTHHIRKGQHPGVKHCCRAHHNSSRNNQGGGYSGGAGGHSPKSMKMSE